MSKYSELEKKYVEVRREYIKLSGEYSILEKKYAEMKLWEEYEKRTKEPIFQFLHDKYSYLERKYKRLLDKYNAMIADRFEYEYRNRPITRCNCCLVPIKDDTPKSEHDFAATKIWNFSTETWDPL